MPKVEAKPEAVKPTTLKPEIRVDERLMPPGKYEVMPDNMIPIDLYLLSKSKRWVILENKTDKTENHQVFFRMWTYDEMIEMRKLATMFDPIKRMHMVDNDKLNQVKVQRLLMSWTFDRDNPRLRLLHVNGVLADEGWAAFKRLQPNIITYILGEMNHVLEFGE
jgi:hypothetical protein